jgi:hypothetical protein
VAVSRLRKSGYVYDKKTGRKRRVSVKRSRIAKRASRRRVHRRLKSTTRAKISRGIRASLRRHKTRGGRRVLRKARHVTSKPFGSRPKLLRRSRSRASQSTSVNPISLFHDGK